MFCKIKFFSSNQRLSTTNLNRFVLTNFFRGIFSLFFYYLVWMLLNWHEMNLRLPLIDFLMDPQRLDEIWPNIC